MIGEMNMKIDVSCIDHNSAALTRDALDGDYTGSEEKDNHDRIEVIGYIRGVHDMAEIMKEVLRA